jgi:hypothetical protein
MSRTRLTFRNQLFCLAMITSGTLAAGCMDSPDPAQIADLDLPAIVDGHRITALPGQAEIRYTRTAKGDSIAVTSPGWTESSPGLWTSPEASDAAKMIIGAAGHRAAIVEGEQRLAQLEQQAALGVDASAEIEQQSAYLGALKQAEQEIANQVAGPAGANALPPICSFNFYIGPSSPAGAGAGGAALASAVCAQACQVMTSTSRVCTNLVGCTPVQTQTALVCGVPVLFGTIAPGTPGFGCSGAVTMLPPGVGVASPFTCG